MEKKMENCQARKKECCSARWDGQQILGYQAGQSMKPLWRSASCAQRSPELLQANWTVPESDNGLNLIDLDRCNKCSKEMCFCKTFFFQNCFPPSVISQPHCANRDCCGQGPGHLLHSTSNHISGILSTDSTEATYTESHPQQLEVASPPAARPGQSLSQPHPSSALAPASSCCCWAFSLAFPPHDHLHGGFTFPDMKRRAWVLSFFLTTTLLLIRASSRDGFCATTDNLCIQEIKNLFQCSWHRVRGGELFLIVGKSLCSTARSHLGSCC